MRGCQSVVWSTSLLASVAASVALLVLWGPTGFAAIREVGDAELEVMLGGADPPPCQQCTGGGETCADGECMEGLGRWTKVVGTHMPDINCLDTGDQTGFYNCSAFSQGLCQTLKVYTDPDCTQFFFDADTVDSYQDCLNFSECPEEPPS